MMARLAILVAGGMLLALCPPSQADEVGKSAPSVTDSYVKGAVSEAKQYIRSYLSINPDCSSMGNAKVTVVTKPEHGHVIVENGEAYPDFSNDNVRGHCNSRKVPAALLYYQSDSGFVGADRLVVDAVMPSGMFYRHEFSINVR
ncbi:hypothetical protein CU669_18490 [Paramagnetospirillum kuznetsovii]|uniref:Uncharacterized protein n=1 Tax=Paramagnetospirillum kuznetsovii TaxID=2053833 RepID=A0A364NTV5_9PROT|nr:hypothetical protein [Paramagnetospirillum kuznetsovii]RAU20440.1 hypothetical protein CU669_18490 [Paramagnetospirillum kuznetsovii]